eukprot:TRINITY_DN37107_c0_g1_i2.p1 TRINITY_DN37107_c0_g1~~TRINITY_DN37107_c0_g1_i2.p1  ORF type:complete len:224 (-),score=11.97 TRINITY_DN37107_c0_g1_i2:80-751(-)
MGRSDAVSPCKRTRAFPCSVRCCRDWALVGVLVPSQLAAISAIASRSFSAFTWPNEAPADIPFERSNLFTEVEFTGRYAAYAGADTWYPTWAADGNLYTPWTDGVVNDVTAGSACGPDGCLSTTGFATVVGDDPLNLTIENAGSFASSPSPYHGRYPCGSLYFNGTWFYGTYMLDNENHEPGVKRAHSDSSRAGYCENWCIQGPFVGFRWSTDKGQTDRKSVV